MSQSSRLAAIKSDSDMRVAENYFKKVKIASSHRSGPDILNDFGMFEQSELGSQLASRLDPLVTAKSSSQPPVVAG